MHHFKILRTFVGPFPMNRIVPETDFLIVEGCDIDHLIDTQSIEEVNDELTEEVMDVGPYNPSGKFYPEVPLPSGEELQIEEVQEVVEEQPQDVAEVETVQEVRPRRKTKV